MAVLAPGRSSVRFESRRASSWPCRKRADEASLEHGPRRARSSARGTGALWRGEGPRAAGASVRPAPRARPREHLPRGGRLLDGPGDAIPRLCAGRRDRRAGRGYRCSLCHAAPDRAGGCSCVLASGGPPPGKWQANLFDEQLPDNLQVIASAMRAGHTFLPSALAVVIEDTPEPSRRRVPPCAGRRAARHPTADWALQRVAEADGEQVTSSAWRSSSRSPSARPAATRLRSWTA